MNVYVRPSLDSPGGFTAASGTSCRPSAPALSGWFINRVHTTSRSSQEGRVYASAGSMVSISPDLLLIRKVPPSLGLAAAPPAP